MRAWKAPALQRTSPGPSSTPAGMARLRRSDLEHRVGTNFVGLARSFAGLEADPLSNPKAPLRGKLKI